MDDEINVQNEIKSLYFRLFTCSHTVANKLNNKEMINILIIRLKSLYIVFTLGLVDMFFGYNFPKLLRNRGICLRHPSKFQRVSRLCSVTARHSNSGRQRNFAALGRGRRLYSAGRPSRWALAHILI